MGRSHIISHFQATLRQSGCRRLSVAASLLLLLLEIHSACTSERADLRERAEEKTKEEVPNQVTVAPELHPGRREDTSYMPPDGLKPVLLKTLSLQKVEVNDTPQRGVSFNPGIALFHGDRWLATRTDRNDKRLIKHGCLDERTIGLVRIDEFGHPLDKHTTLEGLDAHIRCLNLEDGRLFVHNDVLYLVYNTPIEMKKDEFTIIRTFLAEIDVSQVHQPRVAWRRMLTTKDVVLADWEKNWTPFSYASELYFIQQTNPPIVLRLNAQELNDVRDNALAIGTEIDTPIYLARVSERLDPVVQDSNLPQPWRGGTPAYYEESLDEYVSFFHFFTSPDDNKLRRRYYSGFYTFAAEPPFSIRQYVTTPLLLPPVSLARHPVSYVYFPVGLIQDTNQYIISFGEADRVMGLAAVDKYELISRLRAVELSDHDRSSQLE